MIARPTVAQLRMALTPVSIFLVVVAAFTLFWRTSIRHENETIHDEVGMRHYYDEWGRWMDRSPADPDLKYREDHDLMAAAGD